jgi:redox-sensitive bicupin YhaK (pirin superfamily)
MASTAAESAMKRPVTRVIQSHKQREGGGFVVRRPFPSGSTQEIGGIFLMLDHLGPVV